MKNKLQLLLLAIIIISFPTLCFSEVKTFVKEYTYQASEDDSRNSSRVTAMPEVKRLLLEELGTYLESITEVKNFQLTKDQITALTERCRIFDAREPEGKVELCTFPLKKKVHAFLYLVKRSY